MQSFIDALVDLFDICAMIACGALGHRNWMSVLQRVAARRCRGHRRSGYRQTTDP
jgi:hypothetical protein